MRCLTSVGVDERGRVTETNDDNDEDSDADAGGESFKVTVLCPAILLLYVID